MIAALALAALLTTEQLDIETARGSEMERRTVEQLQGLLRRYDVSPWLFTKRVVVDERAIPHSHPVLTLHTRHLGEDSLLLSTFLHEQLHWFLDAHAAAARLAVTELEKRFPDAPVGFPDGADTRQSTYEHLLVTYLERSLLIQVAGGDATSDVMAFWVKDHYRWIYRTMLDHNKEIGAIVARHRLAP